jgi:cytosine/creatinine deaminase
MNRETMNRGLEAAIRLAEESQAEGGIPIGAVLMAEDGAIVAGGHNERVQTGDPTAHAEMVCLRNAGRRRDWRELTLVSTLSPCSMCAGAAVLYRVKRVVVGENTTYLGAERWLTEAGIEVHVLDDERCVALMERLLRDMPDLWSEDIGE